jgi:lipoate-protein ligase A
MAVDEAILLSALDGSAPPTVRFFQWERPSITFGYMLRVERELNTDLCRERQVPFIRRITGGGVVFHGCDITFSIVFPRGLAPDTSNPLSSYRFINGIFLKAFGKLGLSASLLSGGGEKSADARNVCFVEPTTYDVLYNGRKLVGNAQRRRKEWVLNHGSMLLNTGYRQMADLIANIEDPSRAFSENCVSIEEIAPALARQDVLDAVIAQFSRELDVSIERCDLSADETSLSRTLADGKYSSDAWNLDRRVP